MWWPCLDPHSNDQYSTILWLIPIPQLENIPGFISTAVHFGRSSLPHDARDAKVLTGGGKGEKSLEDSTDGLQNQSSFQKRRARVSRK